MITAFRSTLPTRWFEGLNGIEPVNVDVKDTAAVSEPLLVDLFCDKVRADPDLPVLERVRQNEWGRHLQKMCDLWSSAMLTTGRLGPAGVVHKRIQGLEIDLFDLRLGLFGESCDELPDETAAGLFWLKAVGIAESLKFALFHRPGRPGRTGAI